MTDTGTVYHLIPGPDGHGVTEHGLAVARHTGGVIVRDPARMPRPQPGDIAQVTFSDNISSVEEVLRATRGFWLSVSVHDVPQPEEGEQRYRRRCAAYRELAQAADLLVVNSAHEAAFFDEAEIIYLPVPEAPVYPPADPEGVGVLGFIYPGKGHEDLVAEGIKFRALGAYSEGHEGFLGPDAEVTGFLGEEEMAQEIARTQVPVCAHRHFSASGSLMRWIAARRKVVVRDSAYAREMAERFPGYIELVRPPFAPAIAAAQRDPEFSKLQEPIDYGWREVAAQWEALWRRLRGVSVVIPYYNDREKLDAVLAALAQQPVGEVIVADDGSTPPLPPGPGYEVVRQEDLGFRAAAARNLGAAAARCGTLVFLDADTEPLPGCIEALRKAVDAEKDAIWVGARVGGDGAQAEWLEQAYRRSNNLRDDDDANYRFIISAVMAARRRGFVGFDPTMVGYGGEDWEMAWRAWCQGFNLRHEPAARARHLEADWHDRHADAATQTAEKNAETLALAQRITHPTARPAGVAFARCDKTVAIHNFEGTGLNDALIAAWVGAGYGVILPEGMPHPEWAADPRIGTTHVGRTHLELDLPVLPGDVSEDDSLPLIGHRIETRTQRREPVYGKPLTPPLRLERFFAGW